MTCDLPGILECFNETATDRTLNCDSSIQVIKSAHIKVCTADTVCSNNLYSTGYFLSLECPP